MNSAYLTLSGRINSEPQQRQTNNGNIMATCFISASFPQNNGVEYLSVSAVAFGEFAEALLWHGKGDNVTVYGSLTPTSYTKGGEIVKALTLTVFGIQSARSKGKRPQAAAPQGQGHHRGADAQGPGQRQYESARQQQRGKYDQPFHGKGGGRW
ncbi:TPA: single-stranded DNA-binding protein [Escherichia coli]